MDRSILIGLPTYDGTSHSRIHIVRLLKNAPCELQFLEMRTSVLPYNFNILWTATLNHRPRFTDFLLWHADVLPQGEQWLSVLLSERDRVKADVISAVIPIKNEQGMTSTARDTDFWNPDRYSLAEVNAMTEPTWTTPDLLLNTGLMLVDFTKPWVEQVHFQFHDRIVKDEDGKFKAQFAPEDWDFSRQCHTLGLSVYATKAVPVLHRGVYDYPSNGVWGFETDKAYREAMKD